MKTGYAFSEHIRAEKMPRRRGDSSSKSSSLRNFFFPIIIFVTAGIIIFRLFSLQIAQGSYYRSLSDSNRIRTTVIHAPRGIIFDRNGKPLIYNTPGFRKIGKDKKAEIISREEALKRIAKGETDIAIDSLRSYPYKDALAHVLGYVGQITKEELDSGEYEDYAFDDTIGKAGIERQYEKTLAGTDGKELSEVDAMGKKLRLLGQTDPVPGADITLTIDARLQEAAFEAMKPVAKGAVVVTTPDGEILALVSKPSFDPNLFTQDKSYKVASDAAYTNVADILMDGTSQPMLNRAIGGVYPPGSTFKLVAAAAGLEKGAIDKDYIVKDTGVIRVGQFSFSNWFFTQYGRTDGDVDVIKAIKRSNDVFFYKMAEKVGIDSISKTGKEFGIGSVLGIDLPGEVGGVLPTKEWKEKVIGEPWYLGDTFIYGIGQGYLLTTPLQVNVWSQIIAADGDYYVPHLLKKDDKKPARTNLLSKESDALIRQGMIEACSEGGTAYPLFDFKVQNPALKIDGKNILAIDAEATAAAGIKNLKDWRHVPVACKTGTAEHGDEKTKPHAWISAFAPAAKPEIVVTVLAESSGEGSSEAGPIAKKILETWFAQQ
jgi:penicillin-binding protein 2